MAESSGLSPAKVLLLAVEFAVKSDVESFRNIASLYPKTLRADIILRIFLTYLPESLDPSKYVPFLEEIASGQILKTSEKELDTSILKNVSNVEASKKAKRLHLLPLAWPDAPKDVPADHLTLFLIHRTYRIDQEAGILTQLPSLIVPFLDHSSYLRIWMISTLLPLLRLSYEYHPHTSVLQTIATFEALDNHEAIAVLLSRTGVSMDNDKGYNDIGRDLKGLVGPWMYGDNRWKRRKTRRTSILEAQTIAPLDDAVVVDSKCGGWEEVFKWLTTKARTSWEVAVAAIEQWDGPGDVDLGGYEVSTIWLEEEEQQQLERRYARAALAAAYLIPEGSTEALMGVHRILSRIVALMDHDRLSTLPAAASLLPAIPAVFESGIISIDNATFLRNSFLEEGNTLTTPNHASTSLLQALVISAFLLTRTGYHCTIREAGELVLLQDEDDQELALRKYLQNISSGPKADDKYWIRMRNELLWLRSWGAEELLPDGSDPVNQHGSGIFGTIKKEVLEAEILKLLLANTRKYTSVASNPFVH
jgi:hypothetical protein